MDIEFQDKLVVVFCISCGAFETNLSANVSIHFSRPSGIEFSEYSNVCY